MKIEAGMCAYVSGAGSGIGRGIALALARRGVRVGVCDIKLGDAQDTVRQIEAGNSWDEARIFSSRGLSAARAMMP